MARTLSHDTAACIPLSPDASLGGIAGRAGSRCGTHVERPLHLCSRVELLHAMQQLNESEIVIREELRTLRQGYEATMSSFKNDAVSPKFLFAMHKSLLCGTVSAATPNFMRLCS